MEKRLDPREQSVLDQYDQLSDDDFEIERIQRKLDELDQEKKHLLSHLQILKDRQKKKDPNFDYTQIPASPEKKAVPRIQKDLVKESLELALVKESQRNHNEEYIQEKFTRPESVSYFSEQLQNVKEKNHSESKARLELLSHRISSFNGTISEEYIPQEVDEVEEFSGQSINIRYLPKKVLNDLMRNVKILRLPKLFAKIRPPSFHEPEYSNWVVVGVISKKTQPRLSNSVHPKKFFSLTLTDFNFDLPVVFFGKQVVERYFKLNVGEVIAILNPEIMPWKKSDVETQNKSSSFSLKLTKDIKNIVEIGYSKDLAFCEFMLLGKGIKCGFPINKSKQKYCDYHREHAIRSSGARRIELSGSVTMRVPTKNGYQQSVVKDHLGKAKSRISAIKIPGKGIKEVHSQAEANKFLFSSSNASTAFFDENYTNPDILANLDSKRRKIQEARNNKLLEHKLKKLEKSFQCKKEEEEADSSIKESAALTMLHNGFIQNPNVENNLLRNKSSGSKNVAIQDIRNIKKQVVLKPTKKQLIEKHRKRNELYTRIMHDSQESVNQNPQSDDSSDELEIV